VTLTYEIVLRITSNVGRGQSRFCNDLSRIFEKRGQHGGDDLDLVLKVAALKIWNFYKLVESQSITFDPETPSGLCA
jgi:hypothetical protein